MAAHLELVFSPKRAKVSGFDIKTDEPIKVHENMCHMVIQHAEKWPLYAKHLCI